MLKSLFRSPRVQAALGSICAAYWKLIARTTRWTLEGEDEMQRLWEGDQGFILACWHSRIALMPVIPEKLAKRWAPPPVPAAMIISMSRDGGFVANGATKIGLQPIRGSAANKKKKSKDKGGVQALIEANRLLKAGACVCLTPDGPRGPREHAGLGAVRIAQRSGVPIMICASASAPARRLNTWDRFLAPLPFGRGVMIFDGPMACPRDVDPETLRTELEHRMREATKRAEHMVGLAPIERPEPDNTPPAATLDAAE